MLKSALPLTLDRTTLRTRYLANRARTAALFALADPAMFYERPIELRHPFVFYAGHIPAFSFNKLVGEALGAAPVDAALQKLFYRGIDPSDAREAERHAPAAWPARETVEAFGSACDAAVLAAYADAPLDGSASLLLERGEAAYNILEHEEMHHETLLYIMHRVPLERKRTAGRTGTFVEAEPSTRGRAAVAAGTATLGADRGRLAFGWDNEFDETIVDVPAFEIDVNNVTNGDWLVFVRAGGPVPAFWRPAEDGYALLGMFEEMPLPRSWPVYVTQAQARAYAAWRGSRLPTEAEYHRAAFGTPAGDERAFPWGSDLPTSARGNFDFKRFDPEPVGVSPGGTSAWGVNDLVGNGWEWTATPFAPLPGFRPMASYPQYSADFFDDEHYIVKGASPVTNRNHVRRSFRNWYRPEYPYVYATFRTVN